MSLHDAITIARVTRQNSSGADTRYEQLVDGKPEHMPGYTLLHVGPPKRLTAGKTLSTVVTSYFLNAYPMPLWMEDITNVDGVLVRSFGFRPSARNIAKARRRHAARWQPTATV